MKAYTIDDRTAARVIGRNIKRLRGKATRLDLATVSGISRMSLHNYETGSRLPNIRLLLRLASALEVSVADLVAGL